MSEMMLFIGGPADGQRNTVAQPGDRVVYMEAPREMVASGFSSPFGPESIRHIYEPRMVGGSSKKFAVYVHEGMTGDDVMAALLRGYRRAAT